MLGEQAGSKQLGSGSRFVDALQEQFLLINESLLFCHQKLDSLIGPIPTAATDKQKDQTAYNQALAFTLRIKESVQCLADRIKEL